MDLTRLDTAKLAAVLAKAEKKLDEAIALLEPVLFVLTDKERAKMVRPPDGFDKAGRTLAKAAESHPKLAAAVDYDSEAVVEDLDNVAALKPVDLKANKILQLIADSRLTWLAEAYQPSLQLYGVAKVAAKTDGALKTLIEPMAEIFPGRRSKKPPEDK